MVSFLIVTRGDSPQAYFLANYLLARKQRFAILNARRRTWIERGQVLLRLLRRRGVGYAIDLLLGRLLRSRYYQRGTGVYPLGDLERSRRLLADVPRHDADDVHDEASLRFVRRFGPDYILLAGAPLVKPSLFGLARVATWNRHLGMAPTFRGSDCLLWALQQQRFDCLGFTIHEVSGTTDGGGILLQRRILPAPSMSLSEFLAHCKRQGSEGMLEVVGRAIDGEQVTGAAQIAGGTHYPPAPFTTIRRAFRNWSDFMAKRHHDAVGKGHADHPAAPNAALPPGR